MWRAESVGVIDRANKEQVPPDFDTWGGNLICPAQAKCVPFQISSYTALMAHLLCLQGTMLIQKGKLWLIHSAHSWSPCWCHSSVGHVKKRPYRGRGINSSWALHCVPGTVPIPYCSLSLILTASLWVKQGLREKIMSEVTESARGRAEIWNQNHPILLCHASF